DAAGRTLVPGYIEPHAHPWNLASPAALARHVLPLGTTTIFGDTLTVYELGGLAGFETAAAALARGPLKFYWLIRPHGQSRTEDEARRFRVGAIRRMLGNPWAAAIGEVTRWPDVLAGRRDLLARLALAPAPGKRIVGHTAGARARQHAGLRGPAWVRGQSRAPGPRGGRPAGRGLPDGHAQSGELLRQGRRSRRHRARALRRHPAARRPARSASGGGDRARTTGRAR